MTGPRRLAIAIVNGALDVSMKAGDWCFALLDRLGDNTYSCGPAAIEDTQHRLRRVVAEHDVLAAARYARGIRRWLREHRPTEDPLEVLQHQVMASDYMRAIRSEDLAVDALIELTPEAPAA